MIAASKQAIEWRPQPEGLVPYAYGRRVVWAPQSGSQIAFLTCPFYEAMIEGNRGGGKTDVLLMSYLMHVGKGWGADWRGILFRRTYPELADIIEKCYKWIPRIWPEAEYNSGAHVWKWPSGEKLRLAHFMRLKDYWGYHGHSYPWIGWEELTTWPDLDCYLSMMSCSRSDRPGIPIMVRSTTNPYGPGHNIVKERFRLPIRGTKGPVIRDSRNREGELDPPRVVIHSDLSENKVLLHADPKYRERIAAAAKSKAQAAAWLRGDWDIIAGGMLDDVWNHDVHMRPNFPFRLIPPRWRVTRSYDHGQTKPFSVGWWAISNGEPIEWNGVRYGELRGDLIRIAEWYGWSGHPNEGVSLSARKIAQGIIQRESDWGIKVVAGPADNQIFVEDASGDRSPATEMEDEGVYWERSDKSGGSRKRGWELIRTYLESALEYPREYPGLYALDRCEHFKRTMPTLPRDERDLDDVDKNSEDHLADEVRYMLLYVEPQVETATFAGR